MPLSLSRSIPLRRISMAVWFTDRMLSQRTSCARIMEGRCLYTMANCRGIRWASRWPIPREEKPITNCGACPRFSGNRRRSFSIVRAAGDVRANVNPVLLALQSIFVREHNRLADKISTEHSEWNDEEIYQEARKWNVAFLQSICYYEYIPLLGIQLAPYAGYKSTVNPGMRFVHFFAFDRSIDRS